MAPIIRASHILPALVALGLFPARSDASHFIDVDYDDDAVRQKLTLCVASVCLTFGMLLTFLFRPCHPKYGQKTARTFSLAVHIGSSLSLMFFAVFAFFIGDPRIPSAAFAFTAIVAQTPTSIYHASFAYGDRAMTVPFHLIFCALLCYFSVQLLQDLTSFTLLANAFVVLHVYPWSRFFEAISSRLPSLADPDSSRAVGVIAASMLVLPAVVGMAGNLGVLLLFLLSHLVVGLVLQLRGGVRRRIVQETAPEPPSECHVSMTSLPSYNAVQEERNNVGMTSHTPHNAPHSTCAPESPSRCPSDGSLEAPMHSVALTCERSPQHQCNAHNDNGHGTSSRVGAGVGVYDSSLSEKPVPAMDHADIASNAVPPCTIETCPPSRWQWPVLPWRRRKQTDADDPRAREVFDALLAGSDGITVDLSLVIDLLVNWGATPEGARSYLSAFDPGETGLVAFDTFAKNMRPVWVLAHTRAFKGGSIVEALRDAPADFPIKTSANILLHASTSCTVNPSSTPDNSAILVSDSSPDHVDAHEQRTQRKGVLHTSKRTSVASMVTSASRECDNRGHTTAQRRAPPDHASVTVAPVDDSDALVTYRPSGGCRHSQDKLSSGGNAGSSSLGGVTEECPYCSAMSIAAPPSTPTVTGDAAFDFAVAESLVVSVQDNPSVIAVAAEASVVQASPVLSTPTFPLDWFSREDGCCNSTANLGEYDSAESSSIGVDYDDGACASELTSFSNATTITAGTDKDDRGDNYDKESVMSIVSDSMEQRLYLKACDHDGMAQARRHYTCNTDAPSPTTSDLCDPLASLSTSPVHSDAAVTYMSPFVAARLNSTCSLVRRKLAEHTEKMQQQRLDALSDELADCRFVGARASAPTYLGNTFGSLSLASTVAAGGAEHVDDALLYDVEANAGLGDVMRHCNRSGRSVSSGACSSSLFSSSSSRSLGSSLCATATDGVAQSDFDSEEEACELVSVYTVSSAPDAYSRPGVGHILNLSQELLDLSDCASLAGDNNYFSSTWDSGASSPCSSVTGGNRRSYTSACTPMPTQPVSPLSLESSIPLSTSAKWRYLSATFEQPVGDLDGSDCSSNDDCACEGTNALGWPSAAAAAVTAAATKRASYERMTECIHCNRTSPQTAPALAHYADSPITNILGASFTNDQAWLRRSVSAIVRSDADDDEESVSPDWTEWRRYVSTTPAGIDVSSPFESDSNCNVSAVCAPAAAARENADVTEDDYDRLLPSVGVHPSAAATANSFKDLHVPPAHTVVSIPPSINEATLLVTTVGSYAHGSKGAGGKVVMTATGPLSVLQRHAPNRMATASARPDDMTKPTMQHALPGDAPWRPLSKLRTLGVGKKTPLASTEV